MYMYMLKLNGNQPVVAFCTKGCCVAHKKEGYRIVYGVERGGGGGGGGLKPQFGWKLRLLLINTHSFLWFCYFCIINPPPHRPSI